MYEIVTGNLGTTSIIRDYNERKLFQDVVLSFKRFEHKDLPPMWQIVYALHRCKDVPSMRRYLNKTKGIEIV